VRSRYKTKATKTLCDCAVITARRYPSAVFAVVLCVRLSVCLSVCPPQAGIVSNWLDESGLVLARRLPSTYPILCCNEIWVSLQ